MLELEVVVRAVLVAMTMPSKPTLIWTMSRTPLAARQASDSSSDARRWRCPGRRHPCRHQNNDAATVPGFPPLAAAKPVRRA